MKQLFAFLFLASAILINPVHATHILGGELSYRCLGDGNFAFRAVIYRDCSGIHFPALTLPLTGPVTYLVRAFINGPCGSGLNNPRVNDVSSNVVSHGIGTSPPTIARPTIRIYPNPNRGKLMVEGTIVPDALVLRDILGRIVQRVQPTSMITEMDLTNLSAGTYLLEFQSGGQVWFERIMLQQFD